MLSPSRPSASPSAPPEPLWQTSPREVGPVSRSSIQSRLPKPKPQLRVHWRPLRWQRRSFCNAMPSTSSRAVTPHSAVSSSRSRSADPFKCSIRTNRLAATPWRFHLMSEPNFCAFADRSGREAGACSDRRAGIGRFTGHESTLCGGPFGEPRGGAQLRPGRGLRPKDWGASR